jgi:integrase
MRTETTNTAITRDLRVQRANPRAPLTAAEVAAIRPIPGARRVVRDPGCRGLALRVGESGSRTWSLEVKVDGRQRRFTVGNAAALSLADARRRAGALRDSVLNGHDPVEAKRERRRQVQLRRGGGADGGTITTLLDSFERLKARPAGLRSWPGMRKMIEHNFKALLGKAPSALTRADLRGVLDAAVARGAPISGKRGVRYLGRVYGWALKRELVAVNPVKGLDLDELTRAEPPRQRILDDSELRAVWKAAIEAGTPFGDLARLYLLTGLRREEAAAMRWSDLDNGTVLVLQATKTGVSHRLPLSAAALAIIEAQPRRGAGVFTMSNGRPVSAAATSWHRENRKLVDAAGTAPWTWHDLRRTARTLLARIGTDDLVAELILNHAMPGKLRRTYVLHRYQDEMRQALERLAAFIDRAAGGNVVALRAVVGRPAEARWWEASA